VALGSNYELNGTTVNDEDCLGLIKVSLGFALTKTRTKSVKGFSQYERYFSNLARLDMMLLIVFLYSIVALACPRLANLLAVSLRISEFSDFIHSQIHQLAYFGKDTFVSQTIFTSCEFVRESN
jgi:hypothetical protein